MTEKEALNITYKLCSKKEYSSGEIAAKLREWEFPDEKVQEIIQVLIREKFIDDHRYARAFVNDKLKFSRWGKIKIAYMLRQKGVVDDIVREALGEIEDSLYSEILLTELQKKAKKYKSSQRL
ncbi:MAG: RecX family transcriptional regulator [Bacteroidales bacterium]|nr:RecX family transcriptional regulator [Bacteroidales bacterium]